MRRKKVRIGKRQTVAMKGFDTCQAAAMSHTRAMHGVIQAEEVALNIADGERAIDGLVFFRAHLRIVVHMQAESESAPIPLTPFTPRSGGLRLWANWPLRFLSN